MRGALAMADQPNPDWIGPAIGGVATVLAGWLSWWAARFTAKTAKANPQAEINEGFSALLDRVERELSAASQERNTLREELKQERAERELDREAWRLEREAFLGRINQLQAVAEGFERLLRRNGIALPERKVYPPHLAPDHEPAQIVATTLRQDGLGDSDSD